MKTRSRKRMVVWLLVAVVVVVALSLLASRLGRATAGAQAQSGDVVAAFLGDLAATASASGRLTPGREASLALAASGRVAAVLVAVGDEVTAGDPLVRLEFGALERAVENARQSIIIQEANLAELRHGPTVTEIAAAEASVASAQAQLDDLLTGPSPAELAQAQASLNSARAALSAASVRYGALDDQLIVARQELDRAQAAVEQAQWAYDQVANYWQTADYAPHSPQATALANAHSNLEVAQARYNLTAADINNSALASAQAQVAQAEASLAALTETDATAVAAARASLAQAGSSLATLQAGPTPEQSAVAEAQLAQARLALAEAEENLAQATLTAPFDGVVTAVYVAAGELASGVALDLVDMSSLVVVLEVDEIDIGILSVGQPAVITLESYPDQEIAGQIAAIAPRASDSPETVTFQVRLSLEDSPLPLRAGMTANARLVTANREGALLVPNQAITADRAAGRYYVNLRQAAADGRFTYQQVEVTIGLRDAQFTQITGGLSEGDELLVGELPSSSQVPGGPFGGPQGNN